MRAPAERMKAMRARRQAGDLREVRLNLPDPRTSAVRGRVALAVAGLSQDDEADALAWIESVATFEEPDSAPAR